MNRRSFLAASAAVVEAYGDPALAEADHSTWWLRGTVILDQPLPRARLVLDRLATHADVYLEGQRILRSDNLQTLSDADVQLLVEKIGLREVIDLRTSAEVLLEGPGPLRARRAWP